MKTIPTDLNLAHYNVSGNVATLEISGSDEEAPNWRSSFQYTSLNHFPVLYSSAQ